MESHFDFHYELGKLNGKIDQLRIGAKKTPELKMFCEELKEIEQLIILMTEIALSDPERYDFKEKRARKTKGANDELQMRMFG